MDFEHNYFWVLSELNRVEMENDILKRQLTTLKNQNLELKQQVSILAIENSNLEIQHKRKTHTKVPWYNLKKAADNLFFKQDELRSF